MKVRKELNERKIQMNVTIYEMALIMEVRKHRFGKVTAIVTDGVPLRLETNQSIMITDTESFSSVLQNYVENQDNIRSKTEKGGKGKRTTARSA